MRLRGHVAGRQDIPHRPQRRSEGLLRAEDEIHLVAGLRRAGAIARGHGRQGGIYRVNADGSGAPFVTTSQTNITALRVASSGAIIAGTDPGGLVLRISPEGKVFTLFDSSQREIRELALGRNDEIYALALAESAGSGATNAAPASGPPRPGASSSIARTAA